MPASSTCVENLCFCLIQGALSIWASSFVTFRRHSTVSVDGRLKLITIRDLRGSYKGCCQIKPGIHIRSGEFKKKVTLGLYKLRFSQFYVQFINLFCTSCNEENTKRQVKRVFIPPSPYSWLLKIRLRSVLAYLLCQPDTSLLPTFVVRSYHDVTTIVSH